MRSLRRLAGRIAALPIGRRFAGTRGQLGWLQRWYAAQPTQRVVIGVLELRVPCERQPLEAALRELCARHAYALGVCEERGLTRLRLRPLTAADPLPWVEAGPVWDLAAAMTHGAFGPGSPLFRVALDAAGKHVILALDHMIADGVSTALLGTELARLLEGQTLPPLAEPQALPLDARLDLRPRAADLLRARQTKHEAFVALPGDDAPAPLRTRIEPLRLDAALIQALQTRARAHGVTLHCALTAAALLATLDALELQAGRLRVTTPISLRKACQPEPSGIGVYIGGVDGDFGVEQHADAWQLAQRYQAALNRQRSGAQHQVGMLAFAADLGALARAREQKNKGRTATLEVSNVGRLLELPAGYALWLSQGAHYHAALFVLTVAADSGAGLRLCLSYPEPLIDALRARRYCEALAMRLAAMH